MLEVRLSNEGSVRLAELTADTLAWLKSMRVSDDGYGRYRMSQSCEPTALSSCFAALARELMGDLQTLENRERSEWIEFLQRHQDPTTGMFWESQLSAADLSTHSPEHIGRQITYFCLHALDALGARPDHRLRVVEDYSLPGRMAEWLSARDWSRPWFEGNEVMFLLTFMLHENKHYGSDLVLASVCEALDWLDEHQDPTTGYWGTEAGASLFDAMAGAFHIYLFYYYVGRPVQFLEAIIDSTLSLQKQDGLFSAFGGGGSCEDLDAIDILVNMRKLTTYRRADIDAGLRRAWGALLGCQNADGGFRWVSRRDYGPRYWLDLVNPMSRLPNSRYRMTRIGMRNLIRPRVETMAYSGWKLMEYSVSESDVWSSWFRMVALAEISLSGADGVENPCPQSWVFRQLPGLGWHNPNLVLSNGEEERLHMDLATLPKAWRQKVRRRYEYASALTTPGSVVVDAGCGSGWGSVELGNAGARVLAFDIVKSIGPEALEASSSGRLTFLLMDMGYLALRNSSADIVTSFEAIEHVDQPALERFLRECRRVLVHDGVLVGSTPIAAGTVAELHPSNRYHIVEYSANKLLEVIGSVFSDTRFKVLDSNTVVFTASGEAHGPSSPVSARAQAARLHLDWARVHIAMGHQWSAAEHLRQAAIQAPASASVLFEAAGSAVACLASALSRPRYAFRRLLAKARMSVGLRKR